NIPATAGGIDEAALGEVIARALPIDAVGHRIVHGGTELTEPVRVDAAVVRRLEALTDLAPLHQPKSLQGLEVVGRLLPDVPAVACFDTAFHARIPAAAATYALPSEWRRRWPLRRFGFHGLSHAHASRRAALLMGASAREGAPASASTHSSARGDVAPGELRMVTCHLGAGASLAAVQGGVSVDTTMGFTPLEGLVMATRSGSVDPGAVLWAQRHRGLSAEEVEDVLEHRSGLLGLSGISGDLREVTAAAGAGHADAQLAYDVYVHRLRVGVAAMAGALGGLDALVFTGGAGEASSALRVDACRGLGFLGLHLEEAATEAAAAPGPDAAGGPEAATDDGGPEASTGIDRVLSRPPAGAAVLVVRAREDLEIDRHVRELLC
ncbi:MAG: acetate/propionate family kinase, partial [Acidimicrobiales bacterium]